MAADPGDRFLSCQPHLAGNFPATIILITRIFLAPSGKTVVHKVLVLAERRSRPDAQ